MGTNGVGAGVEEPLVAEQPVRARDRSEGREKPGAGAPDSGGVERSERARSVRIIAAQPRGLLRRNLSVAVVGAIIGVVVGLIAGGPSGVSRADAIVRLTLPSGPNLNTVQTTPASSDQVVATEQLSYLTSADYVDDVQRLASGSPPPSVAVAQVGTAPVARITVTAESDAAALAGVKSAIDAYSAHRIAEADAANKRQLASVDAAIDNLLRSGPPDLSVQARIDKLRDVRVGVEMQASVDAAGIQVVQSPALVGGGGAPSWLLPSVLGSVLGALLAVGVVTVLRSRTSLLLDVGRVGAVVDRVLRPELRLRRRDDHRGSIAADPGVARTVLAQIIGRDEPRSRVVVVVAASPRSGSEDVASVIATGAAERESAVIVRAAGNKQPHALTLGVGGSLPGIRGVEAEQIDERLWTVEIDDAAGAPRSESLPSTIERIVGHGYFAVVDAGSIETSRHVAAALRTATDVVLAVGLGVDRDSELAVAVAAVGEVPGGVSAVLTSYSPYDRARLWLEARRG